MSKLSCGHVHNINITRLNTNVSLYIHNCLYIRMIQWKATDYKVTVIFLPIFSMMRVSTHWGTLIVSVFVDTVCATGAGTGVSKHLLADYNLEVVLETGLGICCFGKGG